MAEVAERVLPHNLDAERSVIGAVLIDNEAFAYASAVVDEGAFFRDAHRRIWRQIVGLSDRRQPIDTVTLKEALERAGDLEEVGGPAYVGSLIDGVPRATNVEYYAGIVREKARLRALIFSCNKILADAYEAEQDASVILEQAERGILAIGRDRSRGDFVLASDWFRDVYGQIEAAFQAPREVTGVASGIPTLDRFTRGFQPADLIYIGARPSVGKTSLMLQLALESSRHVMTGVVSVEMSRKVVGLRAFALEARVDAFKLMTGMLNEVEQWRVGQAIETLSQRLLAIDDSSGQTAAAIRGKVRRLAHRYGLGICFIDYIQLLRDPRGKEYENRNQELAQISAALKDLARDLNCPIVVLSQLARASEKEARRPRVSDLRDSGALEADADVVILLHRPGQHEDGARYEEGEEAQLLIAKQRNGPTGTIRLQWLADQMRFGESVADLGQPTLAGVR